MASSTSSTASSCRRTNRPLQRFIPAPAAPPPAIHHEHPDWFRPVFTELERRGLPVERLNAASHRWDTAERTAPYALDFNRASPSAYKRGHVQSTFHTLPWLRHPERIDVPVMNGAEVYALELSKA